MTPEDIQIIDLSGDVKLLEEQLAAATARIAELEAWIDAVPTGALIDYYYGSEAVSYDARQAVKELGAWVRHVEDELARQLQQSEVQP